MKTLLYEFIEKLNHGVIGPAYKRWGRSLLRSGLEIQGSPYYEDRCRKRLRTSGGFVEGCGDKWEASFFGRGKIRVSRLRDIRRGVSRNRGRID